MTHPARDVLITGIGLVSSLGEGIEAHLARLAGEATPQPVIETERFAPYFVHPLPPIDWSRQIPKKGDQRQMETWQKLGTYAAGMALDDAGIAADEATRASVDMIVAAGGGERDVAVDALVMERARAEDSAAAVNETLMTELRPTLFLAQLSNLLAGNISIVHKVTGSSRTFMGEEGAGISALATAVARIRAGQSDICLVGGAFSAERKDLIFNYEMAGLMLRDEWRPVFERSPGKDGLAIGSVGAFILIEAADHAAKRGAASHARIDFVGGDRGRRDGHAMRDRLAELVSASGAIDSELTILSGATGIAELSAAERAVLRDCFPRSALRSYGTVLGHCFEAQVFTGVALGAAALAHRTSFPPFDGRVENAADVAPSRVLVTTVGHVQAEGVCLLGAADGR